MLSKFIPTSITVNSYASMKHHIKMGYNLKKFVVIHNGYQDIDLSKLKEVNKIKSQFKISNSKFILGMIARIDKQKDQIGLIKALKIIEKKIDFQLVLCGFDNKIKIREINKLIKELNFHNKIIIIDPIFNIFELYSILDLHILNSFSESFPNVVAESMFSSIPNIATNTGDTNYIINDFGWITPINDVKKLSNLILECYYLYKNQPDEWRIIKRNCSNHIKLNFSMEKMINNFNLLWK